ncbi:peptidoglycan recognition protein-like, partial [Odontomachus brunneus]|uniref:peptidoglycan recognition protein-like n=1 Tax=Odontomachus brunneus TaxID=486640 RepID=UPI0013F2A72C
RLFCAVFSPARPIESEPISKEISDASDRSPTQSEPGSATERQYRRGDDHREARRLIRSKGEEEPDFLTQWLCTWKCMALLCILALILMTIELGSLYFTRYMDAPVFPEIPDSSLEDVTVNSMRFVERNEWVAQLPSMPLMKLKLPVPYVIISHTATDFCTTQSECTFRVRLAQTYHIEMRNWSDIDYNFLVGGDGLAYVGRSWDYVGAHSFGYNNRSIGISFIGTFHNVKPPKVQLYAAQKIIEIGVETGKIAPDYKLLGHRQVSNTSSPGETLYDILKSWPH